MSSRKVEYAELSSLFLIQGAAMGMWFVPLSTLLDARGLGAIKPFAYATTAVAALVSPLIFGGVADRHMSPVRVLRWLAVATAGAMALAALSIHLGWNRWLILALIQLHAFCSAPSFSISSSIVFARLEDARKEFGPVRAMATLGWMVGCWLVSALAADTSPVAGYSGAVAWLVVAAFTLWLPAVEPPKSDARLSWRERLGWDALALLRNPDHRAVFVVAMLFCIPLAGFYPYAPTHLRDLGFQSTTAWMSLGQVTEIIAMFGLGALLTRWRLKWVFAVGLGFGVLRFLLSAMDGKGWLLAGVALHGASFTAVLITAQIYLDQRVDVAWRVRAQALFSWMNAGVGNLIGFLGGGAWFQACGNWPGARWPLFWGGLAAGAGAVMAYFLIAYHGRGRIVRDTSHGKET